MLKEWIAPLTTETPLQFLFAIVVVLLWQLRTAMNKSRRYVLFAVLAIFFATFVIVVAAALVVFTPDAMIPGPRSQNTRLTGQ